MTRSRSRVAFLAWKLAVLVEATGCGRSHAVDGDDGGATRTTDCALAGGRCQSPDLLCDEGFAWAGAEPCGGSADFVCCRPAAVEAGSDGGGIRRDAGPRDGGRADAGMPDRAADAGEPAVGDGIVCGDAVCDLATEGCLASCLGAGDERVPACVARSEPPDMWPAADCPGGTERFPRHWLACDGAEDCAVGEVCHLLYGSLGQYALCAACEPPCDPTSFHLLCRTDDDCASPAPRCVPNPDLAGYATCRPGDP